MTPPRLHEERERIAVDAPAVRIRGDLVCAQVGDEFPACAGRRVGLSWNERRGGHVNEPRKSAQFGRLTADRGVCLESDRHVGAAHSEQGDGVRPLRASGGVRIRWQSGHDGVLLPAPEAAHRTRRPVADDLRVDEARPAPSPSSLRDIQGAGWSEGEPARIIETAHDDLGIGRAEHRMRVTQRARRPGHIAGRVFTRDEGEPRRHGERGCQPNGKDEREPPRSHEKPP